MIFIKGLIFSKLLNKRNQSESDINYEKIKNDNIACKQKFESIKKENIILKKKIDSYNSLFNEFKELYIVNFNENSNNLNSKKRILFVLHSGSGGTPKTVSDIVKNLHKQFDCFLLTSDTSVMELFFFTGTKFELIESNKLFSDWKIENCYIGEYSAIYFKLLIKYNFDLVHIHHLIFHTFDLPNLCHELNIPVILSLHDLYFICPAYTLLDGDYKYCGGSCSNSNSKYNCFLPMDNITNIKCMKNYVKEWRSLVSQMFLKIDLFIAPSKFINNIFNEYYSLSKTKFKVIEHGIDYDNSKKQLFEVPDKNAPTKILFLGNLYLQKGYPVIKKLYEIDEDKNLEFHFLGFTPKELSGIGTNHGTYQNEELYDKIKKIKPSFIGIFTLCGESYCYTLSEAWSFGIPVLVSELGALNERISDNGGGWFIDIDNMHNSYEKILSIIKNPDEYKSKQEEIKDILLISTSRMSEEYKDVYLNLIK